MKSLFFKNGFHPFHIVDLSPWPLMISLSFMSLFVNTFLFISSLVGNKFMVLISVISILLIMFSWWRDVVRESTFQGFHTKFVCSGIYLGMILFILSEIMFFFSFFFGYFFMALSPDVELGMMWPPMGIKMMNCMGAPLLNSIILVSSGISITWAHHSIIESNINQCKISMLITILLGFIFTFFQIEEYFNSFFSLADSVFGSLFFVTTGFHGLHVLVGTMFILVVMIRVFFLQMSSIHHIGFEASVWYWHFVDVVWLYLFMFMYWWGS